MPHVIAALECIDCSLWFKLLSYDYAVFATDYLFSCMTARCVSDEV